ncbi:MAG TPA: large conductance mechanosensitive channel protein MscL [Pseudonocardiaceae bacterium]|nr:large conductance mechanosensitive channel protein MscL [Pseudonocardiaceae bacterium]
MFDGFKKFIMRGNVLDLAIAVVMGTAFTAVVTAVVTNLINPLIAAIGGGKNSSKLSVQIVSGSTNPKTVIDFSAVITAVINFVIIAAVVYFLFVLPVTKLMERRNRGKKPEAAALTELDVLTEIRDLLQEQRSNG